MKMCTSVKWHEQSASRYDSHKTNPATGLEQRGSADDEEDHRVDEDRM